MERHIPSPLLGSIMRTPPLVIPRPPATPMNLPAPGALTVKLLIMTTVLLRVPHVNVDPSVSRPIPWPSPNEQLSGPGLKMCVLL